MNKAHLHKENYSNSWQLFKMNNRLQSGSERIKNIFFVKKKSRRRFFLIRSPTIDVFHPRGFFPGHTEVEKSDPKQFFGPIFLRLGKKSCLEGFWRPNVWSSGSQESVFSNRFLNRKKLFVSSDFFCCHRKQCIIDKSAPHSIALVTSLKLLR